MSTRFRSEKYPMAPIVVAAIQSSGLELTFSHAPVAADMRTSCRSTWLLSRSSLSFPVVPGVNGPQKVSSAIVTSASGANSLGRGRSQKPSDRTK